MPADYCPNCGKDYTPGEEKYCSRCGAKLPPLKIGKELNSIEQEARRDYEALRFTASLIVLFGWLIIIAGVFGSLAMYSALERLFYEIAPNTSPALSFFPAFVAVGFTLLSGIGAIASGQLIHAIVDIRNDARITSRIARMIYVRLTAGTAINGEGGSETGAGQSS